MVNLSIKKSKRIIILISLAVILSIAAFNPNIFNFSSVSSLTTIDTPNDPIFFDEIKTASYSTDYSNSGKNLNISLHQSKVDVGTPLFEITNASDNNNNTFYIDSPFDSTFNSTLSKIYVENIYAPNKSVDIELETGNTRVLSGTDYYFSFTVPGDGFLNNFSLCLTENYGLPNTDAELTMDLYRSTLSGINLVPLNKYADLVDNYFIANDTTELWHNFTVDQSLDASDTTSNTFFIMIHHVNPAFSNLEICGDSDTGDPDGDKSEVYYYSGGWININVDFACTMDFSPLDNIPLPSQIGLKINGTAAIGTTKGFGNCTIEQDFSSLSNQLDYELTADWWDVSCNITKIQANFTRNDLKAKTNFIIQGSGQSIQWNATREGGLNFFDSDFNNYKINFTVPSNWQNLQTFNGIGNNKTDDTNLGPIIEGYRTLQIFNAGNGTYWFINATSDNLLQKIHTSVNSIEKEIVNFTDTVSFIANFTEPIIDGNINLTVYSPAPGYHTNHTYANASVVKDSEISLKDWFIPDNATNNYGLYKVQVYWNNGTAAGFLEKDLTIMAITNLKLISPQSGREYFGGEIFDITVFYNDTGYNMGDIGITNATLSEDSGLLLGPSTNGTDGYYIYSLNTSDYSFGWNTITFEASKQYFNNATTDFTFYLRINTTITPSNTYDFGDVVKGQNRTYVFSYTDINLNSIQGAILSEVDLPSGFVAALSEDSVTPGNYSIELDTSGVTASILAYTCIFNITAPRNETQYIYLTLTVTIAQTGIEIISKNDFLVQKEGLNQTILFSFNNTDINEGISGLDVSNVTVIDNQTLLPRPSIWLYPTATKGEYILNVSVSDLISGWIQLEINASLPPNYNWTTRSLEFYLRGNTTEINLISIADQDAGEVLTGIGDNYTWFIERDLYLTLNITDLDNSDNLLTGDADLYIIEFIEIGNPTNFGILGNNLDFLIASNTYRGEIFTSNLASVGNYAINITIKLDNYEAAIYNFNLTIMERYSIRLSTIDPPDVKAGDDFTIVIKAEYFDGSDWLPIFDSDIIVTPYFNNVSASPYGPFSTNSSGEAQFVIIVPSGATRMNLSIYLESDYNHQEGTIWVNDIEVIPTSPGLTFEDFIPYLIIIGAALAVVGGSIGVYRGVVVPKKREKSRVLKEVKTIFDDAINLEHILVLYKATGTCIFFKSFGSDAIDPELISGFISAICSFGKDLVCQEELNEITYGDKMLLLSDGEFIRVALVLSKKASIILRKNLMEFINTFEKSYSDDLPSWRGQLTVFKNAGSLVDELLSTSIILPHEITYDYSNVKALKNPHSKDVLKVANNMMEESDRNFFFIATLLKEATEKTSKDTAEIFMGIKELRDKKMLIPIEIGTIEAQPISQQELTLINQKIDQLVSLSPEEKQKLANDLAQMGPAEREAYFVSLVEQQEIISAPIEEKPGVTIIDNMKGAKKEIKKLKKIAKSARKGKDYTRTINICQNAITIAANWELTKELEQLNEFIRSTKIEDLGIKMKNLEKEAKSAAKKEKYNEAAQKYKMSSKIASEIFKLGGTEMTKEVKRLSNKSKEYERLI